MASVMNKKSRKIIAEELCNISSIFWSAIPIERIDEVLREQGWKLVQEDGSDFEGIFCGHDGRTAIEVMEVLSNEYLNSYLVLSWHRFPTGKYEILAYLS